MARSKNKNKQKSKRNNNQVSQLTGGKKKQKSKRNNNQVSQLTGAKNSNKKQKSKRKKSQVSQLTGAKNSSKEQKSKRKNKQVSQLTGSKNQSKKKQKRNQRRAKAPLQRVNRNLHSIDQLKLRLEPLILEANFRWDMLDQHDLRSLAISRAYEESNGQRGFSINNLTDRGEIIAEATRARVFINDETSSLQGAELYTQQESYKQYIGQFGNQYNNWENKFKNFNINTISEDQARVAFAAYRRLEESEAARIMSYGSENTIIAIYDMVIQQGYTDADDISDVTELTESARDLLSREIGEKHAEFQRAFKESNSIGNILDIIEMEGNYDW